MPGVYRRRSYCIQITVSGDDRVDLIYFLDTIPYKGLQLLIDESNFS